jgi:hypothetical protein
MTSLSQKGVLLTLLDIQTWMSSYAGGSIPSSGEADHGFWIKWIQLGQQDAANRAFWRRLLTSTTLTIPANTAVITLPTNFHKVNGIHALFVDDIDWNEKNNTAGIKLFPQLNVTTGAWEVRLITDSLPTSEKTGTLWYFFNPPIPVDEGDTIFLDGEMIGFYALKEYFRKARQPGSQDDARNEYENRLLELLSLEVLPTPQELASWMGYKVHLNKKSNDNNYYRGGKR